MMIALIGGDEEAHRLPSISVLTMVRKMRSVGIESSKGDSPQLEQKHLRFNVSPAAAPACAAKWAGAPVGPQAIGRGLAGKSNWQRWKMMSKIGLLGPVV
jgi:hypothetical protein